RALAVDVDPLVVASRVGEGDDVLEAKRLPGARREVLAAELLELGDSIDRLGGHRSSFSLPSIERELRVPERVKIAFHFVVVDLGERGRVPARPSVLVDHHGAYTLVKVGAAENVLDDAVLEDERLLDLEPGAAAELLEHDLQAGRRGAAQRVER